MDISELEPRADEAVELLAAMANTKRLLILCHLLDNELSVNDLAERVELAQSPLSQHLSKLRALKLVAARRDGQSVRYRLAAIDRFVRHLIMRLPWVGTLEPAGNLLWRPLPLQLGRYCPGQGRTASQLTQLGAQRPMPGGVIRTCSPIPIRATIAMNFTADRGRRSTQGAGDRPQRAPRTEPSGYLLPLAQTERLSGASPAGRPNATGRRDHCEHRGRRPIKPSPDRLH
jgi:DNA-binding transcriptional ArsR family regulator